MVTTAFVGAGVVALGAGALPDAKSVSPSALAELENAAATSEDLAARIADAERATRDDRTQLESSLSEAPDAWVLPLKGYNFTSPYGMRWNKLHAGIDLAAPEGTVYRAIHSGTVTKAGWFGGYGYCVIIQHPDGTESVYGHSSNLLVQEGQQVKAGDEIGWVGNTGHSYGSHLHLEVHVNGEPTDPIPWLRSKGVDIQLQVETIYGGVVDS